MSRSVGECRDARRVSMSTGIRVETGALLNRVQRLLPAPLFAQLDRTITTEGAAQDVMPRFRRSGCDSG
jgi:hypothetical protein